MSLRKHSAARIRGIPTIIAYILIALIAAFLQTSGSLGFLSRMLDEIRFSLTTSEPTGELLIVDIDARSLSEVATWPWPRRFYGELLDKLVDMGASEVAFDIDFSTSSNPADDAAFAAALERSGGIASLAMFRQKAADTRSVQSGIIVNQPIPQFSDHAWPAVVSVPIEEDGRVWRGIWGEFFGDEPVLSMAALLGGRSGDMGRGFYIDYGINPDSLNRLSFIDVLKGNVRPELISGRKILVGASAQELRDLFSVPRFGILPGTVVQALAAESIARNRALVRTGELGTLVLAFLLALPVLSLVRWDWKLRALILIALSVGLELAAVGCQRYFPVILQTAGAQVMLLFLFAFLMIRQIGLGKFLLRIAQAQSHNSRMILTRVFDDSFDGILVIDHEGRVKAVNRSALDILPGQITVGAAAAECLPKEMALPVAQALDIADGNIAPAELREVSVSGKDGTSQVIEFVVTVSSHLDIGGEGTKTGQLRRLVSVTCRDVTEQRLASDQLAYLARHDLVTGLINRAAFEKCLETACAATASQGGRCCAAIISIDGVDRITASLGFGIGDHLRRALTSQLDTLNETPRVTSAIGDNQFACLFNCPTEEAVLCYLDEIASCLNREYTLSGSRIPVTVSIGYTLLSENMFDAQIPLREAGNALSVAVRNGGNCIVRFQDKMRLSLQRRRTVEMELANALKNGEIHVAYQPLVDLKSREMIGVEALMRWEHEALGVISPAEFIPVAEESGRIVELGGWILKRAMEDAARWPGRLRLAINVSPVQFEAPDFIDVVRGALRETGFPAKRLDLELTESLFVDVKPDMEKTIEALRDLGCGLALDDFGTGYSSLGYIPRFPFSKIKVDKSFVDNVCVDAPHAAIVSSVVSLAESFHMTVVAEGIEHPAQEAKLRELGCDIGQGYLFGRPVSADRIRVLLQDAA